VSLNGIDISSNNDAQGTIDWAKVKAVGVDFAIIKLTEGTDKNDTGYINPYFAGDWASAKANGILTAVLHFALMGRNTPADEFAFFAKTFKPYSAAYDVIILDTEQDPYTARDGITIPDDCGPWALSWLNAADAEFGCKPLDYANLDLIQNHGISAVGTNGNGLYLASPDNPNPAVPAPWPFIAIQQTTWTGSIPGIVGAVDQDVFFGTADQWRAYGIPADLPKPPLSPSSDDRLQMVMLAANGTMADLIKYAQRFG
jgi:lysozyme